MNTTAAGIAFLSSTSTYYDAVGLDRTGNRRAGRSTRKVGRPRHRARSQAPTL